jgi:lipid II:glycine glycyltransferase (peptidoglycan interpeptide bridge formation enzyme)
METTNFLQSEPWGEFQELMGNKVFRASFDGNTTQYYLVKSKFANFLYCPRSPITSSSEELSKIIEQLIKDAKENNADFILVEPPTDPGFIVQTLQKKGFVKHKSTTQPAHTSIVSLLPEIEIIYSSFRKTTRQMIKKAMDNKVEIKSYQDLSRWDDFVALLKETAQRQKFTPHTLLYMKEQFECFAKTNNIKLYLAELNGKVLAGAIILSYAKTSIYLHAGSNSLGRDLGAAQLLVWEAIKDSKKEGNQSLDLWGIAPEDQLNHPWAGITIFKQGFGGETVSYPGAFILPVNKLKYDFYLLINFLRNFPPLKTVQRALSRAITKG